MQAMGHLMTMWPMSIGNFLLLRAGACQEKAALAGAAALAEGVEEDTSAQAAAVGNLGHAITQCILGRNERQNCGPACTVQVCFLAKHTNVAQAL